MLDEKSVVRLYTKKLYTLRMIADKYGTDHHKIKRILTKNGVEITTAGRFKKPITDEHRRKIGETSKGRPCYWLGKKMNSNQLYKNMRAHLKYDVSVEWLEGFPDIEKLKVLNHSISRKRDYEGFDTELYKSFIERFYNDEHFNYLYSKWVETKDKWIQPSLDHKHPKCDGGSLTDLDNLRFISWLENRAKVNIPETEWDEIKSRITEYFK